jgi:hypothetical protein
MRKRDLLLRNEVLERPFDCDFLSDIRRNGGSMVCKATASDSQ